MGMNQQHSTPPQPSTKTGRFVIILLLCLGLVPFLGFCYMSLGGIAVGLGERGLYSTGDDAQAIPNTGHIGVAYLLQKETIPQWSPDGTSIVFGSNEGKIYVVDADGSRLSSLSKGSGEYDVDYYPDTSPDGYRIVRATRRHKTGFPWNATNSYEIVVSAVDGSNYHRLTKNRHHDTYPAWSPDGNLIAFIGRQGKLTIMNSDGSLVQENLTRILANHRPLWSPDGGWIAFVDRYYNDTQDLYGDDWDAFPNHYAYAIYTVRPNGSDRRMLGKSVGYPAWSPDGSRIAFVRRESVDTYEDGQAYGSAYGYLYTVSPDGSDPRNLNSLQNEELDDSVSWSPDGSQILLLLESPAVGKEDSSPLTQPQQGLVHSWSPDGSTIAVHVQLSGPGIVLYTMDRDGSNGRALVERNNDGTLSPANGKPLDDRQIATPLYVDAVHGGAPSSTLVDMGHCSNIPDSVLNYDGDVGVDEPDCSPHPFDVMAIED